MQKLRFNFTQTPRSGSLWMDAMDRHFYTKIIKPLMVDDPLPVIHWLMENGLIPRERFCCECNRNMNWIKRKIVTDGYAWQCATKECQSYKKLISIRKDTIFYHSRITLQKFVHVIYCWCSEFSEKHASELTDISRRSIQELYAAFRLACTGYFNQARWPY